MIIYRMTGKHERFKTFEGCGLNFCEPEADTSKDRLIKKVKKMSADHDKENLRHTFIVKKLTLKKFDQTTAIALLGTEGCVEDLIESSETIAAFASEFDKPKVAKLMPEVPLMAGQKEGEPDDNDLEEADSAPKDDKFKDDLQF